MNIVVNLYTSISVLALFVFFDILIRQKGNIILKVNFLAIILCIFISAFLLIFAKNNNQTFIIQIILKAILAGCFLNIYTVIFSPKIKGYIFLLSIYVVLFTLLSLYMNRNQYLYTKVVTLKTIFDLEDNGVKLPFVFQILHKIMLFTYVGVLVYFARLIYFVNHKKNIYYGIIKQWSYYLFTLSILTFILYLPFTFFSKNLENRYIFLSLLYFISLLIILFRPNFINRFSTVLLFNDNFESNIEDIIDEQMFNKAFYDQKYYLKPDASLNNLAAVMNINANDLYKYVYLNFPVTFNEMVNSNRIKYFCYIVSDPKYANYSIDALAKESGFTSRQNLYKPFKKYQGGNPSDLYKVLN